MHQKEKEECAGEIENGRVYKSVADQQALNLPAPMPIPTLPAALDLFDSNTEGAAMVPQL